MSDSKRVRMTKREGALMARLAAKEQEVYEVQACARDLYRARRPVTDFARYVYTDPAVNVEFQLMAAQLGEMENALRLKDAELKELRAMADKGIESKGVKGKANDAAGGADGGGKGIVGKAAQASALLARCQRLEQENEELAASADVAKAATLTSEKAVAEAYAGDLKTALEEAYEYIEQLEEEREVNSNKVYALEEAIRAAAAQAYDRIEGTQVSNGVAVTEGGEFTHGDEEEQRSWEDQHQAHDFGEARQDASTLNKGTVPDESRDGDDGRQDRSGYDSKANEIDDGVTQNQQDKQDKVQGAEKSDGGATQNQALGDDDIYGDYGTGDTEGDSTSHAEGQTRDGSIDSTAEAGEGHVSEGDIYAELNTGNTDKIGESAENVSLEHDDDIYGDLGDGGIVDESKDISTASGAAGPVPMVDEEEETGPGQDPNAADGEGGGEQAANSTKADANADEKEGAEDAMQEADTEQSLSKRPTRKRKTRVH